jgi:predicted enzyme related to lactoylglutathione lyase
MLRRTPEAKVPSDKKIDYIEFPAEDFDAVETFYKAVFNWKFTDYGDTYRAFTDGKLDGGFFKSTKRSCQSDDGAALVVFYAEDLEGLHQAVLANGGVVIKDIFPFPGGRRFHFQDPHGNELAVWSDK